jgi:hypothetical protein
VRSSLHDVAKLLETDGPDLIVAVQALTDDAMGDLAHNVLHLAGLPKISEDPDAIRPLVNSRLGTFHARGTKTEYAVAPTLGGLNLLTATDPRYAASSAFATGAFRTLLYCHGLVVEDPVALACHMLASAPVGSRALARHFVESAVQTATQINELVTADILSLYWVPAKHPRCAGQILDSLRASHEPEKGADLTAQAWDAFEALFVDGLHPGLQETWRRVRAGDRSPDVALLSEAVRDGDAVLARLFVEVVAALDSTVVVENVLESLAIALDDVAALGGRPDIFAPSSLFARILLAPTATVADIDSMRLRELARLSVPRLDGLTWRDLVAIRQNDDAFAEWRTHLGHGLDRIREERAAGRFADARRLLQDELAPARARLSESARRSSSLSRAASGAVSFVLGALGGAVGAASQPAPVTALASLGAGLGAGSATIATSRDAINYTALNRHYVLFDRENP